MEVGFQVGQVVDRDSMSLQQQWRNHLEQFRATRDVGFDIYSWAHHYLIDPFQHFQPLPVLSRLAAEPGTMKLATSVLLLPLLNPVDIAEQVATIDHISQGRFILGLGLGYRPEEFEAFGTKMAHRAARNSEALDLMIRLWTEDNVTHHGRFFDISDARPTAKPYQKPHPKIWLAGMSDPAVRRIGREGHILFIGPAQSYEATKRHINIYRQELDNYGHSVPDDIVLFREFYCANNRVEALGKARSGFLRKYEVYSNHGLQGSDPELSSMVTGGLETQTDSTFIIGSPQDCIRELARYRDLGITQVCLRLYYPGMSQNETLNHIELTGTEVIPEVHRL